MKDNLHLDTIQKYYKGCSIGDIDLMKSTFTPDVTHYFTDHEPVSGAETLANYWAGFNTKERKAEWTVDRFIVAGDEAVIEWTMISIIMKEGHREMLRGAEWYQFREGRIAEIRAYFRWDPEHKASELIGFPYKARSYTLFDKQ